MGAAAFGVRLSRIPRRLTPGRLFNVDAVCLCVHCRICVSVSPEFSATPKTSPGIACGLEVCDGSGSTLHTSVPAVAAVASQLSVLCVSCPWVSRTVFQNQVSPHLFAAENPCAAPTASWDVHMWLQDLVNLDSDFPPPSPPPARTHF